MIYRETVAHPNSTGTLILGQRTQTARLDKRLHVFQQQACRVPVWPAFVGAPEKFGDSGCLAGAVLAHSPDATQRRTSSWPHTTTGWARWRASWRPPWGLTPRLSSSGECGARPVYMHIGYNLVVGMLFWLSRGLGSITSVGIWLPCR